MTAEGLTAINFLAEAARLFNQGSEKQPGLRRALSLAAKELRCPRVCLYKVKYLTWQDFVLQKVAQSPDQTCRENPWELVKDELTPQDWLELQKGRLRSLAGKYGRPQRLLAPVRLQKYLYGVLVLAEMDSEQAGQEKLALLSALQALLELWVAKSDLAKQVDDLLTQIPVPTLIEDTEGFITAWNPAMARRTGWKAESVIGKGDYIHAVPFYYQRRPMASDLMMYPDPDWEAVYVDFQRHGQTTSGMSLCPNLPGGPIYFSFDAAFCYDLNNRLRGVIEFITDVTEEREVRRELRRSESLQRTVTDFARVGIILFSKSKILYMNKYVSELLGVPAGESDIGNLKSLIHPEDTEEVFRDFEHLFAEPQSTAQFEFRRGAGADTNYYRGFAGVLDYEDQPTIHFIFDDITAQKKLEEKARLNELKMYHEDRLTSLGVMAAGIAHELNQPLNTIRVVTDGVLYGMEQGWNQEPDELKEELQMVSRQVGRMSKVIQNIRDFARDDQSQTTSEVDLNLAVENVFSMIGRQLEARGINVHKDLDNALPRVEANLHRMEQVIMNLLVNARQALQDCSRNRKELWVRTGRSNGQVFLEVIDNATGVPADIMPKIFDPFVTSKEVGQGTGLGLSISKSILSEVKGDITFCNNNLGGASFTVTLPAGN